MQGRPSTKVKSVPGGDSSLGYLFGDHHNKQWSFSYNLVWWIKQIIKLGFVCQYIRACFVCVCVCVCDLNIITKGFIYSGLCVLDFDYYVFLGHVT